MLNILKNRVYFEIEEIPNTTTSGIILPDQKKVKVVSGTVLSVGPDVTTIKIGDKIIFPNYATDEIEIDGNKYYSIFEDLIIAVLE